MRKKPIRRSDGRKYKCALNAAKQIAKEQYGDVKIIHSNIVNVANGRPHCHTAYGYGWRWCE